MTSFTFDTWFKRSSLPLLLIMQHIQNVQQDINPSLAHEADRLIKMCIEDKDLGIVDLKLHVKANDHATRHSLHRHATTVCPVESARLSKVLQAQPSQNNSCEMVAKFSCQTELHRGEPYILTLVERIAELHPKNVKGHIPDIVWFHKFDRSSISNITPEGSSSVLYIIVFRRLMPITMLSGNAFLRAWWHAVLCKNKFSGIIFHLLTVMTGHRILWRYGVHHRNISPGNLMVYRTESGEWNGVLINFDSASGQGGPADDNNEVTGTIPFMALDLLAGHSPDGKHLYQHDAESFIWVLAWVCLQYEDGKPRSDDQRPVDCWLKEDAFGCVNTKISFLVFDTHDVQPSSLHQSNWEVAQSCLTTVFQTMYGRGPNLKLKLEDEDVFQTWLKAEVEQRL